MFTSYLFANSLFCLVVNTSHKTYFKYCLFYDNYHIIVTNTLTVKTIRKKVNTMTFFHVLNYSIPITFIIIFGFVLDRICKPTKEKDYE
jgi:hypothetical protein